MTALFRRPVLIGGLMTSASRTARKGSGASLVAGAIQDGIVHVDDI
jgi:hypothetical protein